MAGDWIKVRHDLHTDPAVIRVAELTGLDEYGVVGRLVRLWSWASEHTRDGNADVTPMFVDRYVGVIGFASALASAGWLEVRALDSALGSAEGITFPRFDRHMSQTAKNRALAADRVAAHRLRNCNGAVASAELPEKRREEKSNTPPPTPPPGEQRGPALDTPDGFEAWWALYPRKADKQAARRAWVKLAPDPDLQRTLIADVTARRQTEAWTRDGGRYIPYPATYLNAGRWQDQLDPRAAATSAEPPPFTRTRTTMADAERLLAGMKPQPPREGDPGE